MCSPTPKAPKAAAPSPVATTDIVADTTAKTQPEGARNTEDEVKKRRGTNTLTIPLAAQQGAVPTQGVNLPR